MIEPTVPTDQAERDRIADDLATEIPMNRLLQGDVGSGKPAVAVAALLLASTFGTSFLPSACHILVSYNLPSLQN